MKLYRLKLNVPYRYGEDEKEKREADSAFLAAFKEKHEVESEAPSTPHSFIVDGDTLGDILIATALNTYDEVSVTSVELLYSAPTRLLAKFEGLIEQMEKRISELGGGIVANPNGYSDYQKAPITGAGLAHVNDLLLLECSCTDVVQAALDEGWRILSVCPQDSRRPDYVLGRYVPGFVSTNGAKRSI